MKKDTKSIQKLSAVRKTQLLGIAVIIFSANLYTITRLAANYCVNRLKNVFPDKLRFGSNKKNRWRLVSVGYQVPRPLLLYRQNLVF